jgi:hypothetical protein
VPEITNFDEYNSFRSQNNTVKIAFSEPQVIGKQAMQSTIMEVNPFHFTYIDIPKLDTNRVPWVGWPLQWVKKLVDRVIEISPKYDERETETLTDDEREADSFTNTYSLRFKFVEMKFKFAYVSFKDVAADLGGAQGAAGGFLKGFGTYIMLLFIADLISMLRMKRNHDYLTYKVNSFHNRLPLYRETVEILLKNKTFDQIPEEKVREDYK